MPFRAALNWKIELNYSLCENEREECIVYTYVRERERAVDMESERVL